MSRVANIKHHELSVWLDSWRDDPARFVREALGADPGVSSAEFPQDGWQVDFLNAIATNDRVSVMSGTGTGKSTAVAWAVLWWHVCHYPAKTLVTGAKYEQLRNTMWAEVGRWRKALPAVLRDELTITTERLELKSSREESFAAIQTSAKQNAQNLAGWHSENLLVLVDEASQVLDEIYETLEGNLSTVGSKILLTGNPTQSTGYFADTATKARQFWKLFRVNGEHVSRVSRIYIDRLARRFGPDSNIYRVRVLGLPPKQDADGVIPLEFIEAAVGRDVAPIDVSPIWGLDVARYGDDDSALAKRQGNVLLQKIQTWHGIDTEQVAGVVKQELMETPADQTPSHICVDAIGLGAGVFDELKRDKYLALRKVLVMSVNVSEVPSSSGKYMRLRDELWFKGRIWFEARDCSIQDDEEFIGELATPRYEIGDSNGRLKVESKRTFKERLGKSPDRADAFLLTFAPVERAGRVANATPVGQTIIAQTRFNVWKPGGWEGMRR